MKPFTFQTTKSILSEMGASRRVGELLAAMNCRRVLLVTDKGILNAGLLQPALDGLAGHQITATLYSDVQADPPEAVILDAVASARRHAIDSVLAIGGGSSMDVAKLVALLVGSGENIVGIYGVGNAKGPRLPLILVPTTAGTGSEVTPISIVTTGAEEKKGVVTPLLLPDWAVLDAQLTLGLPPQVTAMTGIDAMVHAIEAFTSKRLKNALSDLLAKQALTLLSAHIEAACTHGRSDPEVRQQMLMGSMLAGMAFANAPVAGVHALAYPIGARFHVAHGLSNSLVLPQVLRFNAEAGAEQYAELADILVPTAAGDAQQKTQQLIVYFEALIDRLQLPARLSQVGIAEKDLDALAADAMLQTRLLINNPKDISQADARAIYAQAL